MIKSDGKYLTIGCFAGRYFYGTLESERGKADLSFLVMEPVDASLN